MRCFVVALVIGAVGCGSQTLPASTAPTGVAQQALSRCSFSLAQPAASGTCSVVSAPFSVHLEIPGGFVDVSAGKNGGSIDYSVRGADCGNFTGSVVFNDIEWPGFDFDLNNRCTEVGSEDVAIIGHVHGILD